MSQYAVPVVWSPDTRLHDPRHEVWVGVPTPATEVAARVDVIVGGVAGRRAPAGGAGRLSRTTCCEAVHDAGLLAFLRTAHERWLEGPYGDLVGQDRVVPYLFPTPAMTDGLPTRPAAAVHAEAGRFGYDTMTLVGPGTWTAARAAADCASYAASLVSAGERTAYALCRPPGHHATRAGLRRLLLPQQRGRRRRDAASGRGRAGRDRRRGRAPRQRHRGDLLRARRRALRVGARRPGRRVVPARGRATPTRPARATVQERPATCRCARAPATRAGWRPCATSPSGRARRATRSSSRSAWTPPRDDPESPLLVSRDGYRRAGELLGGTGLPAVVVQEGGYHLPTLGGLVAAYLAGHTGG